MTSSQLVSVECYAGYRGDETPRRFLLGERSVEVVEMWDCSVSPDHRTFKVKGDDGKCYILRHNSTLDFWEVVTIKKGRSRER